MRRKKSSQRARSHESVILRSAFGSVRPYTRHEQGCPHRRQRDYNDCGCSKWLYVNPRGGKHSRRSLTTPSWAEALAIATRALEGLNPEIAKARADEAKKQKQKTSVEAACDLWLADIASRPTGKQGTWRNCRTITRKLIGWATTHGILYVTDVTTLDLQKWSTSREWTEHADLTRRGRWQRVRSLFAFLKRVRLLDENPAADIEAIRVSTDHVQGPYTEEQVEKIFAAIDDTIKGSVSERKRRADRLRAFMLLLVHSGCDVGDAVLFEQAMIESMKVEGRTVQVLRYNRQKSGVLAVVPLADDVVATLRSVPLLPTNQPGMPFRGGATLRSEAQIWEARIKNVLKQAGVEYVALPPGRGKHGARKKPANVKQFRHTFAVRQLEKGTRPEAVARMMGHKGTEMIYRHYAPWVPSLDEAHVKEVVSGWKS